MDEKIFLEKLKSIILNFYGITEEEKIEFSNVIKNGKSKEVIVSVNESECFKGSYNAEQKLVSCTPIKNN